MVRGFGIAVTRVPSVSQCAEMHRIACGFGNALPSCIHSRAKCVENKNPESCCVCSRIPGLRNKPKGSTFQSLEYLALAEFTHLAQRQQRANTQGDGTIRTFPLRNRKG